MFRKYITFNIVKDESTIIIDRFSRYESGLLGIKYLNITDACLKDRNIYKVTIRCKVKDLQKVLSDILELVRHGFYIDKLDIL